MKKFLTMTALLVGGLLLADAEPAKEEAADNAKPAAPRQMKRQERRGGGNPQIRENMVRRLRDGAAELLKRYDADGDGKLNEAEKAALEKDMKLVEELFPLSVTYRRLKVVDKDGDMQISDEEAANIDMEALRESMQQNRRGMRPERPNRPERPQPRNQQPKPEAKD
jgi:hypothetical protein